jgi:hypothetical protein
MKKSIVLASLLLLISCGARKVDIARIDIKKDSTAITNIVVVTEEVKLKTDSTNVNTKVDEDEITFTPVDSSKEIIIEGKHYKNVVLKIKKTKVNSLYVNNKKESDIKHTDSVASTKVVKKEVVDGKTKIIDKKESIVGNVITYSLLLLFIIIVIIIGRKAYKTYIA